MSISVLIFVHVADWTFPLPMCLVHCTCTLTFAGITTSVSSYLSSTASATSLPMFDGSWWWTTWSTQSCTPTTLSKRSGLFPKHGWFLFWSFWLQDPSATGHCCNHNQPSDCPDACQYCNQLPCIQVFSPSEINFDFYYFSRSEINLVFRHFSHSEINFDLQHYLVLP